MATEQRGQTGVATVASSQGRRHDAWKRWPQGGGSSPAHAGGGASAGCTLPVLRAVNLLPALATPPLLLALLRRLHPEAAPADLLGNALLLALLP